MTIKLTPAEIKGFVGAKLGFSPGSFDLEIVNSDTLLLAAFRQAINEFPRFAFDDKIRCIKRFRELAPRHVDRDGYTSCLIGLADAKWAVENATEALSNLEQTGRIHG